jgi:hypothetical protein
MVEINDAGKWEKFASVTIIVVNINADEPAISFEFADRLNVFFIGKSPFDVRQLADGFDQSMSPGLKNLPFS